MEEEWCCRGRRRVLERKNNQTSESRINSANFIFLFDFLSKHSIISTHYRVLSVYWPNMFQHLFSSFSVLFFLFPCLIWYNFNSDLDVLCTLLCVLQPLLLPPSVTPFEHHPKHGTDCQPNTCYKGASPPHPNSVDERNSCCHSSSTKRASDQIVRGRCRSWAFNVDVDNQGIQRAECSSGGMSS